MLKMFVSEFSENYLGHLKIVFIGQGGYAKFNLTDWNEEYSIDNKTSLSDGYWQVVVNLRIEGNKEVIENKVNNVIKKLEDFDIESLNKELTVPILRWGTLSS